MCKASFFPNAHHAAACVFPWTHYKTWLQLLNRSSHCGFSVGVYVGVYAQHKVSSKSKILSLSSKIMWSKGILVRWLGTNSEPREKLSTNTSVSSLLCTIYQFRESSFLFLLLSVCKVSFVSCSCFEMPHLNLSSHRYSSWFWSNCLILTARLFAIIKNWAS